MRKMTFLLLLTLFSCRQKPTNDYEKSILGEWILVKEVSDNIPSSFHEGVFTAIYNFLPDNICENKPGYFKRIEVTERHDRKTLFLGSKTKYKIDKDSLKIYNLINNTWISQKIVSITPDTMTLKENDSTFLKYKKAN